MKNRVLLSLFLTSLALTPLAQAHHSFASEFDNTKPVKMTGVVTKVEWQNPHIWFYMDVKNPDGSVTNWGFSGGAPGQLTRRGITKKSIPEGAMVTVEGFRSKDGSNNANGARVTFPDGRNVFTASSEDQIPGNDAKNKAK